MQTPRETLLIYVHREPDVKKKTSSQPKRLTGRWRTPHTAGSTQSTFKTGGRSKVRPGSTAAAVCCYHSAPASVLSSAEIPCAPRGCFTGFLVPPTGPWATLNPRKTTMHTRVDTMGWARVYSTVNERCKCRLGVGCEAL